MRKQSWLRNFLRSLWIIPTLLPLGMASFLSFLFVGIRTRNLKWTIAGFIYLISIYGLLMTLGSIEDEDRWVGPFTITIICIWMVSIVHAFWINRTYSNIVLKRHHSPHKNELRNQAYTKEEILKIQQEAAQKTNHKNMNKPPLELTQKININKASEEEINALPGVHSFLAKSIINARNNGENFENMEQLTQSINIKPHILNKALPYIAFSDNELQTVNKQVPKPDKQKSIIYRKSKGRRVDY